MALDEQLARIDGYRELAGFQTEPAQMRAAGPGKVGELRLGFSLRDGRSVLDDLYRVAPLLVQQALYWDEAMPELPIVSVISVGGGILQGDRYRIAIDVGEGACAHVTSQGFNRIHQMDANYASQYQEVRAAAGSYLEYLPNFTLPYRDSRFVSETEIVADETATVLYADMIMSGRKHHHASERFGFDLLSTRVRARRPDGRLIFAEKLLVEKGNDTIELPAVARGYDAFANVLCLTPPDTAARIDERIGINAGPDQPRAMSGVSKLPGGAGLMFRAIGVESYDVRAEVKRFWTAVREEACGRTLAKDFLWQ
jgi:urease accessory protein